MTRLLLLIIAIDVSSAWLPAAATPGNSAAEFDRGNRLYEQGHFAEAAAVYDNLIKAGTQAPAVWFNLGNAAYKSGQIGAAIAAYRVAERLTPRDSALRANLQFVRAKAYSDERARVPFWKNLIRLATPDEWTIGCTVLLWALFVLLAWGELTGKHFSKSAGMFLLLLVAGGSALALAIQDQNTPQALVTAREATVRRGPLDESQAAFQLRDGAELSVVAFKDQWVQIRDLENRMGWVRRDALTLLPTKSISRVQGSVTGPLG
jgi:tetratricopeptide (TPR) repeat protein